MGGWRRRFLGAAAGVGLAVLVCGVSVPIGQAAVESGSPGATQKSEILDEVWKVRNQLLADRVFLRLAASRSLAPAQFSMVRAERGVVILRGLVPSKEAKERALRITLWTPGVLDVRDELLVDPNLEFPKARVADEFLSEQVARSLAREVFNTKSTRAEKEWLYGWEVEGNTWEVEVSTDDAEVSLMGTVPTLWDIRRAVEEARETPGVRCVRSYLTPLDGPAGYPGWRYGRSGPYRPARLYGPQAGYGYYPYYGPPLGAPGPGSPMSYPAEGPAEKN